MSAITKFSFDTTFDLLEPTDKHPEEQDSLPPAPTFTAEDLAAARAEGFTEGHQAGLADGSTALESTATQALNSLAAQLTALGPLCQEGLERCRHDAVGIARAVTRRTVEVFVQDSALKVIEQVLCETLSRVIDEPRVVIRVHNDLHDTVQQRLSSVTDQCGFPGSIILLGEPDLQLPDCRIEWADGGADYSYDAILTEIDDLIERYRAGIDSAAADSTHADDSVAVGADPQPQPEAAQNDQIDIKEQANG